MPLYPDDVVRKTFRTASLRRGYDASDVDAFLEEVVDELRRLRLRVDEYQAEIDRLQRNAAGASTQRAAEEQQLEQIRRERAGLVAELRDADKRIARAGEAVARAESERDAKLQEFEAKLDEDLAILKRRAHDTREEARQLVEAARVEREEVVAHMAALRTEAEEAVAAELGPDHRAKLIDELHEVESTSPMKDLRIIAALAQSVRRDLFELGRTQAEEIVTAAEAERERITAHATTRSEELLDAAQRQYDELLETARVKGDQLLADAHKERDGILAELTTRQDQLQQRIDELDRFQSEYRDRVRGLMTDQLRALDASEWSADTSPASPP